MARCWGGGGTSCADLLLQMRLPQQGSWEEEALGDTGGEGERLLLLNEEAGWEPQQEWDDLSPLPRKADIWRLIRRIFTSCERRCVCPFPHKVVIQGFKNIYIYMWGSSGWLGCENTARTRRKRWRRGEGITAGGHFDRPERHF